MKYADDVTLIESVSSDRASSISLDDCVSLFRSAGLFVNSAKCKQLCIFRFRNVFYAPASDFEIVKCMRILGFYFTDTFNWQAQISNLLRQASQRLHIIRMLKTYCVSKPELIRVYHAIITSIFMYASPAYGHLPATLLAKLEKFQNRGHRLICGTSSCDCDGFPSLLRKHDGAAVNVLLQAEEHVEHPLHGFVPGRLPATQKLRLPVCNTSRRLNSFFVSTALLVNLQR